MSPGDVVCHHIIQRLATHDEPRLAVQHRYDGGTGQPVVVAGHGVAVGTGRGDGDQVTGGDVTWQPAIADHDVPALAVLSDHPAQHRLCVRVPAGQGDG